MLLCVRPRWTPPRRKLPKFLARASRMALKRPRTDGGRRSRGMWQSGEVGGHAAAGGGASRLSSGPVSWCLDEADSQMERRDDGESGEEGAYSLSEGSEESAELEGEDVTRELADVAAKSDRLRAGLRALKRKFSQRRRDHGKIQLRLSALNNVASELATLQSEFQGSSSRNLQLMEDLLAQIARCADQVDALKRARDLTRAELQDLHAACSQEMGRLVQNLEELRRAEELAPTQRYVGAESFAAGGDAAPLMYQQQQRLQFEQETSGCISDDASCPVVLTSLQSRIELVSGQLAELQNEMCEIKQGLAKSSQSFRQQLEDLLAHQMTRIREVQDDEAERLYEEVDGLRSGMITILKDMHILKERTKYLVPSSAKMGSAQLRRHSVPAANTSTPSPIRVRDLRGTMSGANTPGYSLKMTTRMCGNMRPHLEHGYSSDWYCPGIAAEELASAGDEDMLSPRGGDSRGIMEDQQWLQYREEDSRRELEQPPLPPLPPCASPHYSSRSSGVSDRLSVNEGSSQVCCRVRVVLASTDECPGAGADHAEDESPEEALERRLLEQHRQFWIIEGAG